MQEIILFPGHSEVGRKVSWPVVNNMAETVVLFRGEKASLKAEFRWFTKTQISSTRCRKFYNILEVKYILEDGGKMP